MKALRRWQIMAVAVLAIVALAAACSPTDDGTPAGSSGIPSLSQMEALVAGSAFYGTQNQGSGIHVTGVGSVSAQPDVAVLSLGVEAFAETVFEARGVAAEAISGIIAALRAQGVAEAEMKTSRFNIQAEYVYEEVVIMPDGERSTSVRRNERRLVGYRVNNMLTVRVRDMDSVGAIVDAAAEAGGDATRINSIQFTVEEGQSLEERARTLAIQDAVSKAELFARETGATLGKLQYITEVGSPQFAKTESADFRAAGASAAAPTAILPGEQEVMVRVQAVFAID